MIIGRGKGALAFARVPGSPTGVTAVAGDAQAVVSFVPPAGNGGPAITGYVVTSFPGGLTASGGSSPITITGLTNGTSYTFTVKAVNFYGQSAASGASGAVSPHRPTKTVSYPGAGPAMANGGDDVITFNTVGQDWPTPTGLSPSSSHISVPSAGTYNINFGCNFPSSGYTGSGATGWTGTMGNKELWANIWRAGAWVYPTSGASRLGLTSNWFSDPFFQGINQTIALQANDEVVIFGNHGPSGNAVHPWDASLTITQQ